MTFYRNYLDVVNIMIQRIIRESGADHEVDT